VPPQDHHVTIDGRLLVRRAIHHARKAAQADKMK